MTDQSMDLDHRFIRETGLAAAVAELAEPVIEGLGLSLVRVMISGRDGGTAQIMAERAGEQITVEDCAKISRELSPLMDAHDLIDERYFLEVSSPGIDRPLVRLRDFIEWTGYEAKIKLRDAVDDRKRFRGVLAGVEEGEILLSVTFDGETESQTLGFKPAMLEEAKLVMTDELIKAALAGKSAQQA